MGLKRARHPSACGCRLCHAALAAPPPGCSTARRVALLPALPVTPRAALAAIAARHASAGRR
eukprot:6829800-Prymnesium_polylepis.1